MLGGVLADCEQHFLRLEGGYVAHGVELAHIPQWIVTRLSSVRLACDLLIIQGLGSVLLLRTNLLRASDDGSQTFIRRKVVHILFQINVCVFRLFSH